jgi:acetyl-CoA acetyltransferase
MAEVVIAGIGQTPVGEHWELSLRTLAARAIQAARREAHGIDPTGAVYWEFSRLNSFPPGQPGFAACRKRWTGGN